MRRHDRAGRSSYRFQVELTGAWFAHLGPHGRRTVPILGTREQGILRCPPVVRFASRISLRQNLDAPGEDTPLTSLPG